MIVRCPRPVSLPMLVVILAAAVAMGHAEPSPGVSAEAAPTLAIQGLGKATLPLGGPWQFHLGDDPAWAAPALDDSGWEQLTADQPWGAQGHDSYTGFGWYRRHIETQAGPGAATEYALLFDLVDDAYEVYWNGALIGQSGKLPPHPDWPVDQPSPVFKLGRTGDGVLAVRVWKAPLLSSDTGQSGGFEGAPEIGSAEAIAARREIFDYHWLRRNQVSFALDSLYALICLLSLLSWLRDRKQWLLFWMAGFCLNPPLNLLLVGMRIPWSARWATGLAQPVYCIADISLWFLLLWFLQLHDRPALVRWARWAAVVSLALTTLDGLLSVVDWSPRWIGAVQTSDGVLSAVTTVIEAFPLVLVAVAVARRQRLDRARWLVAIFAFLNQMLVAVQSAALQGVRYTHWTLSDTLGMPLFTINGNAVTATALADTLLLLSIVYAVYHFTVEYRGRQNHLEQEFKNARELQQVLVPETLPSLPGFAVTSAYRPALEVGGDFFQIISLEGGSTLVVLGDVSGKGLKAAMTVSLIVGVVRALANIVPAPGKLLSELNQRLCGRLQGGFTTCVALRVEPDGRTVLANAGHPSPFLNHRELELPGALPLGIDPATEYEETSFMLQEGDRFALYTDGLLEARSPSGELFSFARLESLFATNPSAAEATDAAVSFGQDDDITVLTLTRLETGMAPSVLHVAPGV